MELQFEQPKHTEENICRLLNANYTGNSRYKLANVFLFLWESDFFVQKDNGYCYEFEIKISRSDFFNDKKKVQKHEILSGSRQGPKCPNKFFYVVPKGMISITEVPKYAGLVYTDGFCLNIVKPAPFIHKTVHDFSPQLCQKFYYYWLDLKQKVRILEEENKYLKRISSNTQ